MAGFSDPVTYIVPSSANTGEFGSSMCRSTVPRCTSTRCASRVDPQDLVLVPVARVDDPRAVDRPYRGCCRRCSRPPWCRRRASPRRAARPPLRVDPLGDGVPAGPRMLQRARNSRNNSARVQRRARPPTGLAAVATGPPHRRVDRLGVEGQREGQRPARRTRPGTAQSSPRSRRCATRVVPTGPRRAGPTYAGSPSRTVSAATSTASSSAAPSSTTMRLGALLLDDA